MSVIDHVLGLAFDLGGRLLGLAFLWWSAWALLMAGIERMLAVASCVEAAREARRQGRAPILRAWLRFGAKR